jgi:hypothetical protein
MAVLLNLFWRLTLLRATPGDVPWSLPLMLLLLLACAGLNIVARLWLTGLPPLAAFGGTLAGLLLWSLLLAALLRFKSVPERFVQTFTALLGIDLVMTCMSALPLMVVRVAGMEPGLLGVLQVLFLVFFAWDMLAKGAVYREALRIGPTLGNLLALSISFGFLYLDSLLLPGLPASR